MRWLMRLLSLHYTWSCQNGEADIVTSLFRIRVASDCQSRALRIHAGNASP
jgi:hypothetical protein